MQIKTIIETLKEYCDFSQPLTKTNFEDLITDELKAQKNLPYTFTADHGISKLVLLIPHENFVIKIPFTGWFEEDEYNCNYCEWEDAEEADRGPEPQLEDFYYPFEFANTPCITGKNTWDYCALEVAIYEDAIEEGVAQYFAKEWQVEQIDEIPIYAQDRARILDDDEKWDADISEKTTKKCAQLDLRCFNPMWIADFFEAYGEDEFVKLSKFLEKHQIHDLHSGNLGYINDMPVIVDYSCYREW